MTVIETKVKKWGNSFGVVIPMEVINREKIKEEQEIRVILVKDSKKVLGETWGLLKDKIKKPTQQIKDELRKDLY